MSALAALRRDIRHLTPAQFLIVAMTPMAAYTLALIAVFPAKFWA